MSPVLVILVGDEMSWEAIAAFSTLGLTVVVTLVLTMRGLAKIEDNLRDYFDKKQVETYATLKQEINASREMFGESVKAAKEHANLAHHKYDEQLARHQELELYIRDNYVEIDSFNVAVGRIEKTVDGMDEKIDRLMARGTK